MILDVVRHCAWCQRTTTKLNYEQRYLGPVVMRISECVDRDSCDVASILRKSRSGAR